MDDTLVSLHRQESEIGGLRAAVSAMRREVEAVAERSRDHAYRLAELEAEHGAQE